MAIIYTYSIKMRGGMAAVSLTTTSDFVKEHRDEFCNWIKRLGFKPSLVYQVVIFNNKDEINKQVEIRTYDNDTVLDIEKLPDFFKGLDK